MLLCDVAKGNIYVPPQAPLFDRRHYEGGGMFGNKNHPSRRDKPIMDIFTTAWNHEEDEPCWGGSSSAGVRAKMFEED